MKVKFTTDDGEYVISEHDITTPGTSEEYRMAKAKKTAWQAAIDQFYVGHIRADRLAQLISIMERVRDEGRAFNMAAWQAAKPPEHIQECTLRECGTAACLGGWLAVSPEFQASGGQVDPEDGAPIFQYPGHIIHGPDAVLEFLYGRRLFHNEIMDPNNIGAYLTNDGILKATAQDMIDRLKYFQERITPPGNEETGMEAGILDLESMDIPDLENMELDKTGMD